MNATKSIELNFDYQNKHYHGEAVPAYAKQNNETPAFDIYLDDEYNGTIVKTKDRWISDNHFDNGLIAVIGGIIIALFLSM
jgi:hypothetical protein